MRPAFVLPTCSCLSHILDVRVRIQGEKRIYYQVFQTEITFLISTSKLLFNILLEPKMILFGAMIPLDTGNLC